MKQDINITKWFIQRLTGDENTVINWRLYDDKNKGQQAHVLRGSINELWDRLVNYNNDNWSVHCVINEMDDTIVDNRGNVGLKLDNVSYIRSHYVDLDNVYTSHANLEQAIQDGASFVVNSSPNKFHVYFLTQLYKGNNFFSTIQKKLITKYDGDKEVFSANRTLRVPGFLHCKKEPTLITGHDLPAINKRYHFNELVEKYKNIIVNEAIQERKKLGDRSLQAPSFDSMV